MVRSVMAEIVLEYVCPALGVVIGNCMFAAPLRDCYRALKAGEGLQNLNPLPWAFMLGNCLGWVTYAVLIQNLFVLVGNAPGLVMAVWLNLGACKLQNEQFRTHAMKRAVVMALSEQDAAVLASVDRGNGTSLRSASVTQVDGAKDSAAEVSLLRSPPPVKETADLVGNVPAQKVTAPAPQDILILLNVLVWLIVVSLIGFATVFSDTTKQRIVGITVNLNLVVFYAAPLSTIWTVLQTKSAATIHIPT
jgi:solute carrier family 50 (sugar transporter)